MIGKHRGVLTAVVAFISAAPAAAQNYSNLYVFGDSLVDSGNAQAARAATGGADPAPAALGYFEGRFSNGPNFADFLSQAITNGPATASLAGGTNFSFGGAQAAEVVGDASPSFAEQIGFFDASGRSFAADSLVLVTLGGNDVRAELAKLGANPAYTPSLSPAIAALTNGLTSLYARGARNFIVTGLPDVGQIPAVTSFDIDALERAGTQLSFGLNQAFGQVVTGIDALQGADAQFFDFFGYQRRIYANPTAFGLPADLNTTSACLTVAGAAPACNGYVYFDPIHPTTQVHRVVADGLIAQLDITAVPEPAAWAMMIMGVGMAGAGLRYRRRRTTLAYA